MMRMMIWVRKVILQEFLAKEFSISISMMVSKRVIDSMNLDFDDDFDDDLENGKLE